MRKLVFVLLILLVFVPTIAAQQLDGEFAVPELGFKFDLPSTWVSSGMNFAENQADLAALTDANDATQPTGRTITISTLPFADFENDLDQAAATLIPNTQPTETSIMARRSVGVSGVSVQGRAGIVNLWGQDDDLVIFAFSPAETALWESILTSVEPILPDDVELATVQSEELALEMDAPSDWEVLTSEQSIGFFEEARDIASFQNTQVTTASTLFITAQTLETMGLTPDATLEDIQEWMGFNPDNENVVDEGQFIILEQKGFGFRDIDPEAGYGNFTIITLGEDGMVNFYNLSTPDEESLQQWTPVFLALLQSLKPVE